MGEEGKRKKRSEKGREKVHYLREGGRDAFIKREYRGLNMLLIEVEKIRSLQEEPGGAGTSKSKKGRVLERWRRETGNKA